MTFNKSFLSWDRSGYGCRFRRRAGRRSLQEEGCSRHVRQGLQRQWRGRLHNSGQRHLSEDQRLRHGHVFGCQARGGTNGGGSPQKNETILTSPQYVSLDALPAETLAEVVDAMIEFH
jgi:hypothetical protein